MTKSTTVSIVIPNWNGKSLLEKHLPRVVDAAGAAEIIVVDDASIDSSVAFVKKNFPSVRIVEKQKHEGFASTANRGVAVASGDIVVLLNTDVAPEKDFLGPLLRHFEDPQVFAVGCMDKSVENGSVFLRGRGLARWEKGFFIHQRGEVDQSSTAWVSGGSGAFRKSVWDKLGRMDELLNPFYWEDIDISYRALKAGYRLVFEPNSVVLHRHEQGKIKTSYSESFVKRIAYRNQFIFIWKNLSDWGLWQSHILWMPIRLIQAILSGNMMMVVGFWDALVGLQRIIAARYTVQKMKKISDTAVYLGEHL